jgi:hypothetical protein
MDLAGSRRKLGATRTNRKRPAFALGFFVRDAKPEQLFGFTGTLLILNGFIGSGLVANRTTPFLKVGLSQLTPSSPRKVSPKKK